MESWRTDNGPYLSIQTRLVVGLKQVSEGQSFVGSSVLQKEMSGGARDGGKEGRLIFGQVDGLYGFWLILLHI